MKGFRRLKFCAALTLALAAFALTGNAAKAASEYDDKIQIGNTLATYNIFPYDQVHDLYGDYQLALNATTVSSCSSAKTFYSNNYNNVNFVQYMKQHEISSKGSNRLYHEWFFGLKSPGGTSPSTMTITQTGTTPDRQYKLDFATNFQYRVLIQLTNSDDYNQMEVTGKPGYYWGLSCVANNQNGDSVTYFENTDWYRDRPVFISNIAITYPSGYEGSLIPESASPAVEPNETTPAIRMRGFSNWTGQFSDDNFSTFDEVPFLCGDDLAPVINGSLWHIEGEPPTQTATKLDEFTASATAIFTLNLPKSNTEEDYEIRSKYQCGDDDPIFSNSGTYEFTITQSGTLKTATLNDTCLSDTFPYLHFEACMERIFSVIELLFFGNINFGNNGNVWESPQGCVHLSILGDWIGLENKLVCPAYSQTIRNILTPFIMFLLSLGFVRILNSREVN